MRTLRLAVVVGLLRAGAAPAAPPPAPVPGMDHVRSVGEVAADKGVLTVKGGRATLVVGPADADTTGPAAEGAGRGPRA